MQKPPFVGNNPSIIPENNQNNQDWIDCAFGKETTGPAIITKYLLKQLNVELLWGAAINTLEELNKHGWPETTRYIPLPSDIGNANIAKVVFKEIKPGQITSKSLQPIGIAGGWLLTVIPEQIENVLTGAPSQEIRADLLIDTIGFGYSAIVGVAVGAGAGTAATLISGGNPAALVIAGVGAGIVADIAFGAAYDYLIDEYEIRQMMTQAYYEWDQRKLLPEGMDPKLRPTPPENK